MTRAILWAAEALQIHWADPRRVLDKLRPIFPALIFGVRLWLAVCLALYVAFWLELDNAYWAGTSAAIMCQPTLGASLRKGWYRVIGTIIGAVAIVVLTALTVQDRFGFLFGLAVWGAACGFVATLLRNFAAYAAALAGYTAAIIAADELGATGGANGDAFMLAVSRASEISIGIVCAGVVLAATDFGGARRKLGAHVAALASEIAGRISRTFVLSKSEVTDTRLIRRDLLRRVIGLDPIIDEAIGEASDLRYHSPTLHAAVGGLFSALAAWRVIAVHLEQMPNDRERHEEAVIRDHLPQELRTAPIEGGAANWIEDPSRVHRACGSAMRALTALPDRAPSLRLLADRTAEAMMGLQRAANGLLLINNPARAARRSRSAGFLMPDWLPALVNAARILVTIVAAELFWLATAWPSGASAIAFAAVAVILFSPQADRAYGMAMGFLIGTALTAVAAGIIAFAVLPGVETFFAFSLAIGLMLVPAGALMTQSWQTAVFVAMTFNFVPLLAPANPMVFNLLQFYNMSLGVTAGVGIGVLAFRLLPPLSPAFRTRRLLALTLRDLRRLAARPMPQSTTRWEARNFSRLSQLPEQATPLQRAQVLAALSVGTDIVRLAHVAHRFGLDGDLEPALAAVARGDCLAATEGLAGFDRTLNALPDTMPGKRIRFRARGRVLALSEALAQHEAYFSAIASPEGTTI
jgi:uncharacterized membrane protein YccC